MVRADVIGVAERIVEKNRVRFENFSELISHPARMHWIAPTRLLRFFFILLIELPLGNFESFAPFGDATHIALR